MCKNRRGMGPWDCTCLVLCILKYNCGFSLHGPRSLLKLDLQRRMAGRGEHSWQWLGGEVVGGVGEVARGGGSG